MSPMRTCTKHGRARCQACAAEQAARRPPRRSYSDTAEYRSMVLQVQATYGDACVYCRELIGAGDPLAADPARAFVLAHYPIAHADGGPFTVENLRPSHKRCNQLAGRG